jgi:hypothetical protein
LRGQKGWRADGQRYELSEVAKKTPRFLREQGLGKKNCQILAK